MLLQLGLAQGLFVHAMRKLCFVFFSRSVFPTMVKSDPVAACTLCWCITFLALILWVCTHPSCRSMWLVYYTCKRDSLEPRQVTCMLERLFFCVCRVNHSLLTHRSSTNVWIITSCSEDRSTLVYSRQYFYRAMCLFAENLAFLLWGGNEVKRILRIDTAPFNENREKGEWTSLLASADFALLLTECVLISGTLDGTCWKFQSCFIHVAVWLSNRLRKRSCSSVQSSPVQSSSVHWLQTPPYWRLTLQGNTR